MSCADSSGGVARHDRLAVSCGELKYRLSLTATGGRHLPGESHPSTLAVRSPTRDGPHCKACLIARAITPGSGAVHLLATTGEVSPEIGSDLEVAYDLLPDLADTWIATPDRYCYRRWDKGVVAGWPGTSETKDK